MILLQTNVSYMIFYIAHSVQLPTFLHMVKAIYNSYGT